MEAVTLTNKEARRLWLSYHGLYGGFRFSGRDGVLEFVRRSGCIQFDPVDVCGRNADLVLQARVRGYRPRILEELLYKDRLLVDYFDKNLAILPVEDWPYFGCTRRMHEQHERSRAEIRAACDTVKRHICENGPTGSVDLPLDGCVDWYWSETKLSRAVLEHLYFCGELAVHHKQGTNKVYDLIENCLPPEVLAAPEAHEGEALLRWWVLRRIRSVGLLWNRPSDAWLGIPGLKAEQRNAAFASLLKDGEILPMQVEGVRDPLYTTPELLEELERLRRKPTARKRCVFLAPLDNFLWDRRLVEAVFGFAYKWEIYTPEEQRRYGRYVLPVLYGDGFAGRIEMVANRKARTLEIRRFWPEDGLKRPTAFDACLREAIRRFAAVFALEPSFTDFRDT